MEKKFVRLTEEISDYLLEIKQKFDDFDSQSPSLQEQIDFIEANKSPIFKKLDSHFKSVWNIVELLDKNQYKISQKYYQDKLIPYFILSPLNKRIYEKPLGYDGDYLTITYYYDDDYQGKSTFGKLLHRYTLSISMAIAVRNMIKYFDKFVAQAINIFDGRCSVIDVGCGPAREILNFINNNEMADRCVFNCIDFEKATLDKIGEDVEKIKREKDGKINVNLIYRPIIEFIRMRAQKSLVDQSYIYSFGLFDYLKDKTASRVLEYMYSRLSDGGFLVVSNFMPNVSHLAYLEFLGGWDLILRDEPHFRTLLSNIPAKNVAFEVDPDTKDNLYLILSK